MSNDENDGHRNRRRSRGGGRGARGGGGQTQNRWRQLEPNYRQWLIARGIAGNTEAFNGMPTHERIEASSAYATETAQATDLSDLLHVTTVLRCTLAAQANPYEVVSESHYSQDDSAEARQASIDYYGLLNERYCQILGPQPEQIKIINAHIWPRHAASQIGLFNLRARDIHTPRNVIRLQKDIERAFDSRKVTFVGQAGHFVLSALSAYREHFSYGHARAIRRYRWSQTQNSFKKAKHTSFQKAPCSPLRPCASICQGNGVDNR
jgi:hypothetical protein